MLASCANDLLYDSALIGADVGQIYSMCGLVVVVAAKQIVL